MGLRGKPRQPPVTGSFAAEFAGHRARLGLTLADFAAKLGVSYGAAQKWELGRREPDEFKRAAILQKLQAMKTPKI